MLALAHVEYVYGYVLASRDRDEAHNRWVREKILRAKMRNRASRGLVDSGNTVILIEHNMEIVKNGDWIIDMGPEGGGKGGEILAEGTPQEIIKIERSYRGQYLANALKE